MELLLDGFCNLVERLAVQLDPGFELRLVGRRQLVISVTTLQNRDDVFVCRCGWECLYLVPAM